MTGKSKATRKQNEQEFKAAQLRDAQEKQTLIDTQLRQKQALQQQIIKVRQAQQQDMTDLQAGFVQVLKGHQKLEELQVTFSRAALSKAQQIEVNHSNDNAPRIGL